MRVANDDVFEASGEYATAKVPRYVVWRSLPDYTVRFVCAKEVKSPTLASTCLAIFRAEE